MSVLDSARGVGRRDFLAVGLGAFVVGGLPLAVLRRRTLGVTVRRTVPIMGSTVDFVVVHRDAALGHAAIDAALERLRFVERTMTRFDPRSDVGRANAGASRAPVAVNAATAEVIAEGLRWAEASDGAFDPAIGAATELWDVAHRREPPPADRVRRLAARGFWRHVAIERRAGEPVVSFDVPDLHLDLGGIAAGYAVDLAAAELRARGVEHALINQSGDIYALGGAPGGEPWRIGVRMPDDPDGIARTLEVRDQAVATSGDYQQFFRWNGVRFHHLLDPATAAPRRALVRSTTVVADRCIDADAASTAVFGMAPERADALLGARAPGARLVRLT